MKKFVIFAILFLFPFISAVDIDMKNDFNQRETLIAKFSGNFLESVSKDNVLFYREHVKIPIDFEIMNVENNYYIYALNDKSPGNYSLYLENLKYYKQGEIIEEPISKNFTINENFADFSINPGFIITKTDFKIELQNFQDQEITININQEIIVQNESTEQGFFEGLFGNLFLSLTGSITLNIEEENSITLSPNEIKTITFEVDNIKEPVLKKISFYSENNFYEFLVYIPSPVDKNKYSISLNFEPSELKISLTPNITKEEIVILENIGDELLENITLEISNNLEPYVNISKNEIYNLNTNQSEEIYLFFAPTNQSMKIEGELTAKIPDETEDLVIVFEMLGDESDLIIPSKSKTCEELNGTIFEEPQICNGEERFAKDGNCCIGKVEVPKKSDTGLIIGWTIIMTIIIALVWFFKFKYKKSKGEIDLFKIAKGKK
ncbi:MAG: hypothetical protein ABFQ65_00555 [Nanoarchaeota archaeon]